MSHCVQAKNLWPFLPKRQIWSISIIMCNITQKTKCNVTEYGSVSSQHHDHLSLRGHLGLTFAWTQEWTLIVKYQRSLTEQEVIHLLKHNITQVSTWANDADMTFTI